MWEMQLIPIVGVVSMSAVAMTCIRAFVRYLEIRKQNNPAIASAEMHEMQERLARIEAVVETTAIEVERIAEANRFMSKLLAERTVTTAPILARVNQPERVITPH